MGTKGTEIVGLDVRELLAELNKAYADEWLAFYQYWVGAQMVTGRPAAKAVSSELMRVAMEELEHADELAVRITQLGGRPLDNPKQWYEMTNCGYTEPPKEPSNLEAIIKQVIEAEGCAIGVYDRLAKMTFQKDPITYQLMIHIMEEEIEHEDTFENLLS